MDKVDDSSRQFTTSSSTPSSPIVGDVCTESVKNSVQCRTPALDAVYGPGAEAAVSAARLLVVGAGGVGCELVKNLASVGFAHVTLIDLDTIDFSNLNRQFLFRRQHVGKPKATQAAQAIQSLLPGTVVKGIMANIKNPQFSVDFFKTFSVVCNALDNLDARRHVNRMCLAAKVPLIDSGSTGYTGQVDVLGQGYECYDCIKRPEPRSFAVCTIRSTPERPVHCVVWAKFLLQLVFGPPDADNLLSDLDGGADTTTTDQTLHSNDAQQDVNGHVSQNGVIPNGDEHSDFETPSGKIDTTHINGKKNDDANNGTDVSDSTDCEKKAKRVRLLPSDTPESFSRRVCERVFVDDIEVQRRMDSLWRERAPPEIIDVPALAEKHPVKLRHVNPLSQSVWDVNMSASVFFQVLQHFVVNRQHDIGNINFDKDDTDAVLFVTAAANLRAAIYGVPLSSPFTIKGIAGNIVHAIATTNAIVGGLVVLEAIKLVVSGGDLSRSSKTFVAKKECGSRVRSLLLTDPMRKPNPQCFVCSQGQLTLSVDVDDMTLQTLISSVLQNNMSVAEPSVHVTTGDFHNTVYECGTGLDEDEIETYEHNAKLTLSQLRIGNGSQLVVEDLRQKLRFTLHVRHAKGLYADMPSDRRFTLDGNLPDDHSTPKRTENDDKHNNDGEIEDVDDDVAEVQVDSTQPDWFALENKQKNRKSDTTSGASQISGAKRRLNEGEEVGHLVSPLNEEVHEQLSKKARA